MRLYFICVAVMAFFTGLPGFTRAAGSVKFKAGLGYDFISQVYFIDSISLSGDDSLDFSLKTNYLDDFKGQLWIRYYPSETGFNSFQIGYEQTRDFFRTRLLSDFTSKFGKSKFDFNSELEWKHSIKEAASDPGYLFGSARSKLTFPLGRSVKGRIQLNGESVAFDSTGDLNYNYYRLTGKTGMIISTSGYSLITADLFVSARKVPDSTELDYSFTGLDFSYLGKLGEADFDLMARLSKKDYNRADDQKDFYRYELEANARWPLSEMVYLYQKLETEKVRYIDDPVNSDYLRFSLELLPSYGTDNWSLGLGPAFESLKQETDEDYYSSEDYFEYGLKADLNLMRIGSHYISFDSEFGYRQLKEENDLQTNFNYERLSLIGDLTMVSSLKLNLILSSEWEWHGNPDENARIVLISCSISQSF